MPNLTTKFVETVKPKAIRKEYPDGRIKGLYFIVQPSGGKSWALRYRFNEKTRKLKLGNFPEITLAEARNLASENLFLLARGQDPAHLKQERRAEQTEKGALLDEIIQTYLNEHVDAKHRSAADTRSIFEKRVLPAWKNRQIDTVTRADVTKQIDRLIADGMPVAANNLFSAVRRFFNWSIEREYLEDSPCKGLKMPTHEVSRDRVLSDDEVRWLWQATQTEGYPFGTLVRLLLLTGQRRTEVAAMSWDELSTKDKIWSIPGSRTKNARAHHVPLPKAIWSEIVVIPKIGEQPGFIFTTNGETHFSGYSKAKRRLDALMLKAAKAEAETVGSDHKEIKITNWRLHDLRRTAASGMARLGHPVQVVEAVLNHKSGAVRGVAAIYNRYDYAGEKRKALKGWAKYVEKAVNAESR